MQSKKKRLYFTVMAVSGVALLVDRFFLPGEIPKAAGATETVGTFVPPITPGTRMSIPELPFPRDIRSIAEDAQVADLFAPPHLDRAKNPNADNSTPPSLGSLDPSQLSGEVFKATHRLEGVLVNADLKIANLDGQWIHVGGLIDGCALVDVRGREAQFKCYDDDTVLHIEGGSSAP
ncbi:MAG: hypothetical protein JSU63_22000 [Phycisphaerales bacterium]|nr:MAG: hypothetical protein JSU63_22000 [Phycisphaerales bacterium]